MILHHGRTRFQAPTELGRLVHPMDGVEGFLPDYRCLLIDLMQVSEDELPKDDPRLFAVLSVMQSVFGSGISRALHDGVRRLAAVLDRPETQNTLSVIMSYVLQSARQLTDQEFLAAIEPLGKSGEDTMSALIEKWKEEGRAEGREEGRIEERRNSILDILATRFESVPETVRQAVGGIADGERLLHLATEAIRCESVEQFVEHLK